MSEKSCCWVTPRGKIYQCDFSHATFCGKYLKQAPRLKKEYLKWAKEHPAKHMYEFFELALRWVKCHNGKWCVSAETRLTKSQKEVMYELTGWKEE